MENHNLYRIKKTLRKVVGKWIRPWQLKPPLMPWKRPFKPSKKPRRTAAKTIHKMTTMATQHQQRKRVQSSNRKYPSQRETTKSLSSSRNTIHPKQNKHVLEYYYFKTCDQHKQRFYSPPSSGTHTFVTCSGVSAFASSRLARRSLRLRSRLPTASISMWICVCVG